MLLQEFRELGESDLEDETQLDLDKPRKTILNNDLEEFKEPSIHEHSLKNNEEYGVMESGLETPVPQRTESDF